MYGMVSPAPELDVHLISLLLRLRFLVFARSPATAEHDAAGRQGRQHCYLPPRARDGVRVRHEAGDDVHRAHGRLTRGAPGKSDRRHAIHAGVLTSGGYWGRGGRGGGVSSSTCRCRCLSLLTDYLSHSILCLCSCPVQA